MHVTDHATSIACSAQVAFTCTASDAAEPMVLSMTAADAQKYFDQVKYLASDQEKEIYWELSATGKQNFLLNFWKSKDPTPETPENEFMMEHFRRLAYCERKFSGALNSDMARIYIKYGSPMEVSREASTATINRPLEIWTYALDGRREFVFVDRTSDGRYVLVHSNHPEEYSNPNWADDYKN
jgi:GWxTD domain-containing protein